MEADVLKLKKIYAKCDERRNRYVKINDSSSIGFIDDLLMITSVATGAMRVFAGMVEHVWNRVQCPKF